MSINQCVQCGKAYHAWSLALAEGDDKAAARAEFFLNKTAASHGLSRTELRAVVEDTIGPQP